MLARPTTMYWAERNFPSFTAWGFHQAAQGDLVFLGDLLDLVAIDDGHLVDRGQQDVDLVGQGIPAVVAARSAAPRRSGISRTSREPLDRWDSELPPGWDFARPLLHGEDSDADYPQLLVLFLAPATWPFGPRPAWAGWPSLASLPATPRRRPGPLPRGEIRSFRGATALAAALALLAATRATADPPKPAAARTAKSQDKEKNKELRVIRIAVFAIEAQGVRSSPAAVPVPSDPAIRPMSAKCPSVAGPRTARPPPPGHPDRPDQRPPVRDRQGDHRQPRPDPPRGGGTPDCAERPGRPVQRRQAREIPLAQYIVTGRASKIGQTFYLVLKIVDVETTEQTTVSAKAAAESGFAGCLTAFPNRCLRPSANSNVLWPRPADTALAELRKLAQALASKVVLVSVDETHVGRPLRDPAAAWRPSRAASQPGLHGDRAQRPRNRLEGVALANRPIWRQEGRFPAEGEGTSAFAAQLQGLTSCRARVELRIDRRAGTGRHHQRPRSGGGRRSGRGPGGQDGPGRGRHAGCDAVIRRAVAELQKKEK